MTEKDVWAATDTLRPTEAGKKRKPVVLFFVSGSYIGGLEMMALQLMRELKKEGCSVYCIINAWNDTAFKDMLGRDGTPFYEVKLGWLHLRKPLWTLDTLVHWPGAYAKAKRIINELKPDILHFHNFPNYVFLYPLIKTKAVYTLHETHVPAKKINFIYKLLSRKIDAFVGVSGFIRDCLRKLPVDAAKIKTIYNGIDVSGQPQVRTVRDHPFTFGIVGQVIQHKGHELLIKAVERLIQKKYSFRVKIFGKANDGYAVVLKKEIAAKNLQAFFEWKGFEQNKNTIYSQLDAVVVPTLTPEPLSLSKMEAMYHYCPVIVSDSGGNPELVTDGTDGFIFEAGNDADLAAKLEYFLKNPEKATDMGEAGHRSIKEYSVQRMTAEYMNLYDTLLEK